MELERFHPFRITATDSGQVIPQIAQRLYQARLPLICGLKDQSLETQHAAVHLARQCDAAIDWTSGIDSWARHAALQSVGHVSCTFQEIKERADLVVFVACDPRQSRPQFVDRFLQGKKLVRVEGDRRRLSETFRLLRAHDFPKQATAGYEEVKILAQQIDEARYPVIIHDDQLAGLAGNTGIQSLYRYVRMQNDRNHCRLICLANGVCDNGIQSTMNSTAGAPFGVAWREGRPLFRGREFSVDSLIRKGLVDQVVVIGSPDSLPQIPESLYENLVWIRDLPHPEFKGELEIHTSRWGIESAGSGIRDDGVIIERPALIDSMRPLARDVLAEIATQIAKRRN